MSATTNKFVIGTRPSHEHNVNGETIKCNSPYCDYMDAHPKHQENQRSPWKDVED